LLLNEPRPDNITISSVKPFKHICLFNKLHSKA